MQARAVRVGGPGPLEHVAGDCGRVVDRVGVGHAQDCAETAERGGAETGGDVFFILEAGLAQMYVGVDEAGEDVKTRGVDALGVGGQIQGTGRPQTGDATVRDQNIVRGAVQIRAKDGKGGSLVRRHKRHPRCGFPR